MERRTIVFFMFFLCDFLIVICGFEVLVDEQLVMPMKYTREELSRLAGYGEERLSSVFVVGSVLCEGCSGKDYVKGAKVGVGCKTKWGAKKTTWAGSASTDEDGDFIIDLPSQLHGLQNLQQACIVKVLQVPKQSPCHHKHARKQAGIRLSSSPLGGNMRMYTAGTIAIENQRHCKKKGWVGVSFW